MVNKTPKADLRSYQTIFSQIGIILSLLLLILIVKIELRAEPANSDVHIVVEDFKPVEIPITKEPEKPAPPKPTVTVEVVDDVIIDDIIEFPEFDMAAEPFELSLPPKIETDENETFESWAVELMPEMEGGQALLYSKIKYPELAKKAGIDGLVSVSFIVNEVGELEDLQVIRSIGGGCDEEVLRVMKEMKFTPGIQNGRFVRVKMVQSVRFQLKN